MYFVGMRANTLVLGLVSERSEGIIVEKGLSDFKAHEYVCTGIP